MNAHNHDFAESVEEDADSLEQAARRISLSLRLQSGLDTDTRIVRDGKKTAMVFAADDTDTQTLKRFLCEEMRGAAQPSCRERMVPFELQDYPLSNRRGSWPCLLMISILIVNCNKTLGILRF